MRCTAPTSASHTDVAHFAARVLLGVGCGQTHELVVPADLLHAALVQGNWVCEEHLQYDVTGMAEEGLLPGPVGLCVREKGVRGQVQHGETSAAESVSLRANGGQHQDHIVIGCVHTVEVCKVQSDVGVQQVSSRDVKAQGTVGGVPGRKACVKLCVATEEDSV